MVFPIVLAGVSAIVWGSADFSGGKASQRGNPLAVTVISQVLGLPALAVCLLLVPGTPNATDMLWGAASGVAGLVGIVLLYRALATGAMTVAAPTAAVTAAVVAIGIGLITDAAPGALALAGIACAILAITLVSMGAGRGGAVTGRLIALSLAAGVFLGGFFGLLGQATADSGMWPLIGTRVASIGVGVLWMLVTRTPARLGRWSMLWSIPAGVLDIAANALYLAAAGRGQLSVVAAIASLYPASTVLLALAVDRERLRFVQLAGLGFAATALLLASA